MKIVGVKTRNSGSAVLLEDVPGVDGQLDVWCSADMETVQSWNGKPPDDFELKDGKNGKILVQKRGGGGGGYRNTKEAFDAEAKSRREWQVLEEERKDRRTALMTAFENGVEVGSDVAVGAALRAAERMYDWLRETSGGGSRATAPDRSGEGSRHAPSPDRPRPGEGIDAEESSARSGSALTPSPGFPVDPAVCDHKTASGAWVKWVAARSGEGLMTVSQQVCPKCGTPKVSAMESTNADLGSPTGAAVPQADVGSA